MWLASQLAVENGYDHIEKIRIDKDLETLFDGNRFKEIFRKYDEEHPTLKGITKKRFRSNPSSYN